MYFKCNLSSILSYYSLQYLTEKHQSNTGTNNLETKRNKIWSFLHLFYLIILMSVFLCLQVKSVNLSEGEQLSIRGADERGALLVLANHTLLVEGQVIRSPTNTLSVYYRSTPDGNMGIFQLHYQSESTRCVCAPALT